MMRTFALALAATASFAIAAPASAALFVVRAADNNFAGGAGTGVSSVSVAAGQTILVSSSTNDLWSAGDLPRFSDANGLVGPRFATAADDSGQPVGTQIGADFGPYSAAGFSTAYGTLVGRIGSTYYNLGANSSTVAANSGVLELFYWDQPGEDNFGEIAFDISAVPEPTTWALMLLGFGVVGLGLRRRAGSLPALQVA